MVHSYPNYAGRQVILEEILTEVPFSGEIHLDLARHIGEDEDRQASPFYILPVDSFDGIIYATLPKAGQLEDIRIGFQRRIGFAEVNYFAPNSKGEIEETEFDENTLYIPVVLTGHLVRKGRKNVPFPVLGIHGFNGIHPLLFTSKTEDGRSYRGLCQGRRGIESFDCSSFSGHGSVDAVATRFLRQAALSKKSKVKIGEAETKNAEIDWDEPKSIVQFLDRYVIGQEEAKKVLAVAFSNYMARMKSGRDDLPVGHVLILGSTGVGKTLTASQLAKEAGIPFAHSAVSAKSTEGYRGNNLSMVFDIIWEQTKSRAPYGVVFFDEVDKAVAGDPQNDFFAPKLNDELIAWLGGTSVKTEGHMEEADVVIDTSNLLFICAGAFHDNGKKQSLADCIENRLGRADNVVGFGAESRRKQKTADYSVLHQVRPEDLIAYGLKTELVGRLTTIGVFNPLSVEDKIKILTNAKGSALERYKNLLGMKGYNTEVDMEAIELIAQRCPVKTGARSLNAVCSDLFLDVLFDPMQFADSSKVIHITRELAERLIKLYK